MQTPRYRWPTPNQVNNIVQNVRRKERLLMDPLKAIGLFAKLNPDKIFHYTEVDYSTNPPSNFATGIQHPFAVQAMILWAGEHGIGFDSSYRHKNKNRAPVTFLTTLDDNSHMIPGPVFLSSDVTAPTLTIFLHKVKKLVESMAKELIAGTKEIDAGLESDRARVLAQARTIVQAGWSPHFFMIDKCRAERTAIYNGVFYDLIYCQTILICLLVFPQATVRICQFHVMQAILRWDKEHGDTFEPQPRPTLSLQCKHALLAAVRRLQRCRLSEDWDGDVERFKCDVEKLCEGSSASSKDILSYFRVNWFTEDWRDLWTDIGLPAGELREKMLSTNNWTERAFKTFDQVFLGGRANKSAYHLVLIIANEWF
ncbi:hypothetical protein CPB83DRAFT_513029 [Crepidotus variabilis]|uniref:MULE transposase domain-containing protein n=1 Tax=Crepidotus variabilis TaxID=179855 RepID=A0A9P6JMR2_9AGAR|nr:hypothetical protein CPB83DRAFT_513029 [Crepidotus variabilis]